MGCRLRGKGLIDGGWGRWPRQQYDTSDHLDPVGRNLGSQRSPGHRRRGLQSGPRHQQQRRGGGFVLHYLRQHQRYHRRHNVELQLLDIDVGGHQKISTIRIGTQLCNPKDAIHGVWRWPSTRRHRRGPGVPVRSHRWRSEPQRHAVRNRRHDRQPRWRRIPRRPSQFYQRQRGHCRQYQRVRESFG